MIPVLLSTILPYVLTRVSGALVSSLLLKLGASQSAAQTGSSLISQIASKLGAGKPLTDPEKTVWNAHFQASYPQQTKPAVEVTSAPGVPFVRS